MNTLTFQRLEENFNDQLTSDCLDKLKEFRTFLDTLQPSKQTHYHLLDETFKPIYKFVRDSLHYFGFVNGNVEKNKEKPDVLFWFSIYTQIDCFFFSKYFYDIEGHNDSARHHASAYVRLECLKKELDNFIKLKNI